MIAEQFFMSAATQKVIEPVIKDENLHYMHMVLPQGEGLPVHRTNATVYMTVVSGVLTLQLADEAPIRVEAKTVLKIPFDVKMDARNEDGETLELFVVKAPAPKAPAPKA